jgi:hypothetical protein
MVVARIGWWKLEVFSCLHSALTACATRTTLNLSRQGSRATQLLEVGPNKLF